MDSPPLDNFVLHTAEKHWAMGEFGPCLIVIWRGAGTEQAARQIGARLAALTQARPAKCAYINIIEKNAPPPPGPLRKMAMEDLARAGSTLSCMAATIEGNEFRASLVRAVMTGITLLRAQGQPAKFFKTVTDLSKWVQAMLHDTGTLDKEIVLAAEWLRSSIPK